MEVLIFIGKMFIALIIAGTVLTMYVITKYIRWSLYEEEVYRDIAEHRNTKGIAYCPKCGKEIKVNISKAIDSEGEVFMCPECKYRFRFTEK